MMSHSPPARRLTTGKVVSGRQLHLTYAGTVIKHLGADLYSGAVPALAELVANAWDADAKHVWITIPLDTLISSTMSIEVRDDGVGMSFQEVQDHYLRVGINRRVRGETTPGGRRVMGRKGLGKFAAFGSAHLVEVWTVKNQHVTAFRMNYDTIVAGDFVETSQPLEVIADRKPSKSDPLKKGTLVVLRDLQLTRSISKADFRGSMARRFAVLGDQFQVSVNRKELKRGEMSFEFRFPAKGMTEEEIPGAGPVRWWAGFTKTPILAEQARGLVVFARGKLAQAPFFFNMAGGTQGQHGLQYLTGEVHADFLDAEIDLIATDRASVNWEEPRAASLLQWGQAKIRELLREWVKNRIAGRVKALRDTTKLLERIERFPERQRAELTSAINRLASIETIEDERLTELVDFLVKAYENETFMGLIRALNAADESAQEEIFKLVAEWDVLEAIATAQVVKGRVEIIRKFRALIEAKAKEKPDMQDFVREHPWLIDPAWQTLEHEKSLERVVREYFSKGKKGGSTKKRLDFFCLADSGRAVVVEVKRPGDSVGQAEMRQLMDYVDYLREWMKRSDRPNQIATVNGTLICSKVKPGAEGEKERARKDGVTVLTWEGMLQTAETLHKDFLEVVKDRAPVNDPRIERIEDIGRRKPQKSTAKRKRSSAVR